MKRIINIDGIDIEMKCTGATPSFYRELFNRDLFIEFARLSKLFQKDESGNLTINDFGIDFSIVEDLAYTMAYQANREIGTKLEWLDQFEHSSAILDAIGEILELYMDGLQTTSQLKKKNGRPIEK